MESFVILKIKQLSSEWCITYNAPNTSYQMKGMGCLVSNLAYLLFQIYFFLFIFNLFFKDVTSPGQFLPSHLGEAGLILLVSLLEKKKDYYVKISGCNISLKRH